MHHPFKFFGINFPFSPCLPLGTHSPFHTQTHAPSSLSLLIIPPSPTSWLVIFSEASPRSPLCICDLSLSIAVPLYSQALHSIHLCLSPASPHSPHPSLLLPYSYPLSFLSTSLCCVSWQPSFSLTLCTENAHSPVEYVNRWVHNL